MGITSIMRDFVGHPNIVRIITTDNYSTITTPAYLYLQTANIQAANNGNFEWLPSDIVFISYSDGKGFFTVTGSALSLQTFTSLAPGNSLLQSAEVSITAAQFNGMYAAPVQLVAAPGANQLLILDQFQLFMDYNSVAYAAGGTAAVQYDSTVNGAGVIASTTLANTAFQATASSTFTFNPGVVVLPAATTVNKGLYLSNISAAFTTGNSPFVAYVWYRVVPTT